MTQLASERKEKAKCLLSEGLSITEVSKLIGVNRSTVWKWSKIWNLTSHKYKVCNRTKIRSNNIVRIYSGTGSIDELSSSNSNLGSQFTSLDNTNQLNGFKDQLKTNKVDHTSKKLIFNKIGALD